MFRFFRRKPSPSDAARALSKVGRDQQREKVKAVARQMRAELGLPPAPALEPRR